MNFSDSSTFKSFIWQVIAIHMITYFIMGIIGFLLFDYETLYSTTELANYMRSTDSKWVAAGAGLQFIRGGIFAVVLWPFRSVILDTTLGWVKLAGLLIGIGIFSTYGPSPGSIEGMIYTILPVKLHLIALPEIILQALIFSYFLVGWIKQPAKWKNIAAVIFTILIFFISSMGAMV